MYKDLKNELASFNVDFADGITLFSNPELMSEFDTDSEGEGLCRKRTSYRSQEVTLSCLIDVLVHITNSCSK